MKKRVISYLFVLLLLASCDETPTLQLVEQDASDFRAVSLTNDDGFIVDDSNNAFVISDSYLDELVFADIIDEANNSSELDENIEAVTIISSDGIAFAIDQIQSPNSNSDCWNSLYFWQIVHSYSGVTLPNPLSEVYVDQFLGEMARQMNLEDYFGQRAWPHLFEVCGEEFKLTNWGEVYGFTYDGNNVEQSDDFESIFVGWSTSTTTSAMLLQPITENEENYGKSYSCLVEAVEFSRTEELQQGSAAQLIAIGECIENAINWPQAATPQIEGFNTFKFPYSSSEFVINETVIYFQAIAQQTGAILHVGEGCMIPALIGLGYPASILSEIVDPDPSDPLVLLQILGDLWEQENWNEDFLEYAALICYRPDAAHLASYPSGSIWDAIFEDSSLQITDDPNNEVQSEFYLASLGGIAMISPYTNENFLSSLVTCLRESTHELAENAGQTLAENQAILLTGCLVSTGAPDLLYQLLPNLLDSDPGGDFIVIGGGIQAGLANQIGIGGGSGTISNYCIPHPILGEDDTLNEVRPAEFIQALNNSEADKQSSDNDPAFTSLPCNVIATSGQVGDGLRARIAANEAFAAPDVFVDAYAAALSAMRFSACAESALGMERRFEIENSGTNDLNPDEIQQLVNTCVDLGFIDYNQPQLFIEMSADPNNLDSALLNSFIFASADNLPKLSTLTYVLIDGNLAPIFALDTSGSIHSIEGVATRTTGLFNMDELLAVNNIFVDEKNNPALAVDGITFERGFTLVIPNDADQLNGFEEITLLLSDEELRASFSQLVQTINVFDFAYNIEEFADISNDGKVQLEYDSDEITDRDTGRVDETPLDGDDEGPSGESFLDQQPQEVIDCARVALADFDAIFNRKRPPTSSEAEQIRACVSNAGSR